MNFLVKSWGAFRRFVSGMPVGLQVLSMVLGFSAGIVMAVGAVFVPPLGAALLGAGGAALLGGAAAEGVATTQIEARANRIAGPSDQVTWDARNIPSLATTAAATVGVADSSLGNALLGDARTVSGDLAAANAALKPFEKDAGPYPGYGLPPEKELPGDERRLAKAVAALKADETKAVADLEAADKIAPTLGIAGELKLDRLR